MKKTIIAFMALAGVVAAAETSVDIVTSMMPEVKPAFSVASTEINLSWDPTFKGNAAEEATAMTDAFSSLGINSTGYYTFNQYGNNQNSGSITLNSGVLSIGAPSSNDSGSNSGSMFYAAIVSVADLLQGKEFDDLNDITLTLKGDSHGSNDSWFSIYSMDTTNTLTTIVELAYNNDGTTSLKSNGDSNSWNGTNSYTIQADALEATDKVVLLVRHSGSSNLEFTDMYATANLTVPEPTTATLSLLALCGLAARRRRK